MNKCSITTRIHCASIYLSKPQESPTLLSSGDIIYLLKSGFLKKENATFGTYIVLQTARAMNTIPCILQGIFLFLPCIAVCLLFFSSCVPAFFEHPAKQNSV